jgi:hypothetical protein
MLDSSCHFSPTRSTAKAFDVTHGLRNGFRVRRFHFEHAMQAAFNLRHAKNAQVLDKSIQFSAGEPESG